TPPPVYKLPATPMSVQRNTAPGRPHTAATKTAPPAVPPTYRPRPVPHGLAQTREIAVTHSKPSSGAPNFPPVAHAPARPAPRAVKSNTVQPLLSALVLGGAAAGYGAYRLVSSLGETLGSAAQQGLADAFSDDLWEHQLLGGRPEFHDQHLANYA